MPRGNGTGPMGMGRMTGRGLGYCADFGSPGCLNQSGFGRRLSPRKVTAFSERTFLSNQADILENQLQQVKMRLESLNKETE